MSAVSGGGNYISDGAIMAWLANQQDRIYGDLRNSMDLAESRASFADDLNDIKAGLADANRTHDFGKVDGELQAFMEKYGSDPNFAETCEALQGVASQIHTNYEYASKGHPEAFDKYRQDLLDYDVAVATQSQLVAGPNGSMDYAAVEKEVPTPPADPIVSYSKEQIDGWSTKIDGKLDVSSKNDQLTMIHIQELKATLDQGAQLGSTFISSGDKTSSSIINNIA